MRREHWLLPLMLVMVSFLGCVESVEPLIPCPNLYSGQIPDYDFIERQFFYFENPGDDFRQAGFGEIFPVVGGPSNDEIEVFVSLEPQVPPFDYEYIGNVYVDADNRRFRVWNDPANPAPDDSLGIPHFGRYKQLFIEDGDFALIRGYTPGGGDVRYIGIELSRPIEIQRRLAVRYRARNVYTGHEYVVGNYRGYKPAASAQTGFVGKAICLSMSETTGLRATDPTWNFMMRNVYSLGLSQIDPKSLRIRIEDTSNSRNKSIHSESGLSYLRIFGLDRVINATGLLGKDGLVDNTFKVIDYERGYIMFPWYEPFNPPAEVVNAVLADDADPREVSFDYSTLVRADGIYLEALTDRIKEINHRYNIIVEIVNEQRICRSSTFDIIEGAKPSP